MKFFKTAFSEIGNQFSLRIDSKFRESWDVFKGNPFQESKLNMRELSDLLSPLPIKRVKKGKLDEEYFLLSISETEAKYGRLENSVFSVMEIGSDKTILNDAEFIISKLVTSKGYMFTNEGTIDNLIGSTELIPYERRRSDVDLTFLRHLLLLDECLEFYANLETGKTPSQKRVNPIDILQMFVPDVPYSKQLEVGEKIRELEVEMDHLSSEIQNKNVLINDILIKEYNIDINKVKGIPKPSKYTKDLSAVSSSFDLRFSYRFNAEKYDELLSQIYQNKFLPLKDYLSEPIRLGASVSPSDYDDENGEAIYISMSSISQWKVNIEDSKKVSDEYFNKNRIGNSLKKGDLIIARSGEGTIGKVAILEENVDAIFADFTMRVRISEENNPKFFYYYFCSDLFQFMVEKEKKGLGNNTNFFPNQLKQFPIIHSSLKEQNNIVDKIESRLDKVYKAEKDLILKKQEIDTLIRDTFS